MTLSCANGFGFQQAWVAQALKGITEYPDIFTKSSINFAMQYFGIGNKKVEALQFWIRASGLAQLSPEGSMSLTHLGSLVLSFDPNCEMDGTWWFIHACLSRFKHELGLRDSTTWRWYTHRFMEVKFNKERLREALAGAHPETSERTISSAINELVNSLQGCPLGTLGLLRAEGTDFVRQSPPPGRMHPAALGFAIVSWATDKTRAEETVHISELSAGEAPIRRLFNLSEARFRDELLQLTDYYGSGVFGFNTTAGLNSVVLFEHDPLALVGAYYRENTSGITPRSALEESRRA